MYLCMVWMAECSLVPRLLPSLGMRLAECSPKHVLNGIQDKNSGNLFIV